MTTAKSLKSFEEIEAWERARELVKKVYEVSGQGSFGKDFVLRDQIRKASISIMANIAEGFERGGDKEFIQFLSVAKASVAEVKSHLFIALDQAYLPKIVFDEILSLANEVARMIAGLMRYLANSSLKGSKFK